MGLMGKELDMADGRLIVTITWAYVIALVAVAAATVVWLFVSPSEGSSTVAGLWFAVAGFGGLVIVILVLVQASRP